MQIWEVQRASLVSNVLLHEIMESMTLRIFQSFVGYSVTGQSAIDI